MCNVDENCGELKVSMPPIEEQLEKCREELREAHKHLSRVEDENEVLKRMFVREYNGHELGKNAAEEHAKLCNNMHNDLYAIRNLLFHSEPKPRMSKAVKQEIINILRRNHIFCSEEI